MPADLFTILPAHSPLQPIIANLPHSGLQVPPDIADQFTPQHLRSLPNSDWHLQELYRFLPSLGITLMQANYSRYVVDLNRALQPPFLGSFWSAVVPEQTAFKQTIYRRLPTREEVRSRIDEFYTPYHQQLKRLIDDAIAQFGSVILLDLHSFMGLITDDVCLGNLNGQTCSPALIDQFAESFANSQYQVVKNKVFTGGFITRHYGQQPQVSALQIEIRYPLYLSDDQLKADPNSAQSVPRDIPLWQGPKFDQAQVSLARIFKQVIAQNALL